MALKVRRATPSDVEDIASLLGPCVRRGELLPRDPSEILKSIDQWFVAIEGDRILGCGSLVTYSDELSEVRSLAVDPDWRGRGIGQALMRELMQAARQLGIRRLFALTRAVPFFVQSGFSTIDMGDIPEKVWRDCAPCPLRDRCDEHPVMLILSDKAGDRRVRPALRRGERPHAAP